MTNARENWQEAGFGLYVHWPFCQSKCPYCDFNSHVVAAVDQRRWAAALAAEIARLAEELPGRQLNSIFFGGGTPSLMEPETVEAVIDAARRGWRFANDIEISLEANPTSVERGRFRGFADAGVGRLSMGVQALNDADLRRLGRMHSVVEARAAFDVARDCFGRVSFDLIYARQDQTLDDWRRELGEAVAMAVDHLSLYQLTIEEGTAFGARHAAGGLKGLPEEDVAADMYLLTQDLLADAGMPAYEVSNHARDGAVCRHNLIYWRQGDWAAVGPGAHGRFSVGGARWETVAHRAPGAWLEAVEGRGNGDVERVRQLDADRATEYLLMSMRLDEGMDLARLEAMSGGIDLAAAARLEAMGFLSRADGRLRATREGRPLLNAILRELAV